VEYQFLSPSRNSLQMSYLAGLLAFRRSKAFQTGWNAATYCIYCTYGNIIAAIPRFRKK